MRGIKTRKQARIQNQIDRCFCLVFVLIGIIGFGWDFMMWYFMGTQTWLLVVGGVCACALILLSLAWYEVLEREASRFWDRD